MCIQCQSGKEKEIIHQLNELAKVNARGTLGVYDIVATVESDSLDSMRKIISDQIRKIKGITSTITLLETEDPELDDLIPDVIPEEKKPLEPPEEMEDEYEEDEDDDWDDDDDYEEKARRT